MRSTGETVQGHGTAPGGYPARYTEDDTGRHWAEPEDMTPERADSMNEAKWAAFGKEGVVPAWAEEFLFLGEKSE